MRQGHQLAGITLLWLVGLEIDWDSLVPHCIMGSRDEWESPMFFRPKWQFLCTALTADNCLPFGLCKGTVKESKRGPRPSLWPRRRRLPACVSERLCYPVCYAGWQITPDQYLLQLGSSPGNLVKSSSRERCPTSQAKITRMTLPSENSLCFHSANVVLFLCKTDSNSTPTQGCRITYSTLQCRCNALTRLHNFETNNDCSNTCIQATLVE